MQFLAEPDPWDFESGLISFIAIFAWCERAGEDFFDYHDEFSKYKEPILNQLIREGILTEEDKRCFLSDKYCNSIGNIAGYIDEHYGKPIEEMKDAEESSHIFEICENKVYQVFADYMAKYHSHELYSACFDNSGNYQECQWGEEHQRYYTFQYYKLKSKSILEEIQ